MTVDSNLFKLLSSISFRDMLKYFENIIFFTGNGTISKSPKRLCRFSLNIKLCFFERLTKSRTVKFIDKQTNYKYSINLAEKNVEQTSVPL